MRKKIIYIEKINKYIYGICLSFPSQKLKNMESMIFQKGAWYSSKTLGLKFKYVSGGIANDIPFIYVENEDGSNATITSSMVMDELVPAARSIEYRVGDWIRFNSYAEHGPLNFGKVKSIDGTHVLCEPWILYDELNGNHGTWDISDMYDVNRIKPSNTAIQSALPDGHEDKVPLEIVDEPVNNPTHYGGADNPYEAIKVIEAWDLNFCLGNVVKYISRAGKKDNELEDLLKAQWYLNKHIESWEER